MPRYVVDEDGGLSARPADQDAVPRRVVERGVPGLLDPRKPSVVDVAKTQNVSQEGLVGIPSVLLSDVEQRPQVERPQFRPLFRGHLSAQPHELRIPRLCQPRQEVLGQRSLQRQRLLGGEQAGVHGKTRHGLGDHEGVLPFVLDDPPVRPHGDSPPVLVLGLLDDARVRETVTLDQRPSHQKVQDGEREPGADQMPFPQRSSTLEARTRAGRPRVTVAPRPRARPSWRATRRRRDRARAFPRRPAVPEARPTTPRPAAPSASPGAPCSRCRY